MDLEKQSNMKYVSHWAEELQVGDKCLATIRHHSDGSKNIHNAECIVIENDLNKKQIKAFCLNEEMLINYNELTAHN